MISRAAAGNLDCFEIDEERALSSYRRAEDFLVLARQTLCACNTKFGIPGAPAGAILFLE
jgi:hypothetical protein